MFTDYKFFLQSSAFSANFILGKLVILPIFQQMEDKLQVFLPTTAFNLLHAYSHSSAKSRCSISYQQA